MKKFIPTSIITNKYINYDRLQKYASIHPQRLVPSVKFHNLHVDDELMEMQEMHHIGHFIFQRELPKVPRSMSWFVSQSVSQFVSVCVSVFQNSYQGPSRLCRELRFCLELVHTSQHTLNPQRSLAEQCHTQDFYLRCFKSDFDDVKSNLDLLIEQIEKTTSKMKTT